jgi:regulator of sigma E protease
MLDLFGAGLVSLAAFVAVISFVVVIHELGHYSAGRFFGVHADAFSIGFGPTLASWRARRGTIWRIAALPLGGYVKFRGDSNAASAPDRDELERLRAKRDDADTVFHFKPVWQRAIIVAAGPVANFILAIVLFAILGVARGEVVVEPRVSDVVAESPADAAGFQPGDLVLAINGNAVESFTDITSTVMLRAGHELRFTVEREGGQIELLATPRREMRADGLGGERAMGFLGLAAQSERVVRRYSVWEAPGYGVRRTWEMSETILDYMGRLITGRASIEYVNGPVGIATTAGQIANNAVSGAPVDTTVQVGLGDRVIQLVTGLVLLSALLSVALGLMNLLPIPVLDGGHLVYYAYEAIAQKPPSPALQAAGFKLGLVLILGLLAVATWNDLSYLRGMFS